MKSLVLVCIAMLVLVNASPLHKSKHGVRSKSKEHKLNKATLLAEALEKLAKAPVPDTLAKASVPDTLAKASVPDTLAKASVSDTLAKAPVPDTLAKAPVPDTLA